MDILNYLNSVLDYKFGNNDVRHFMYAFLAFSVIYFSFKIFKSVIVKKLKLLSKKTKNDFDDYLIKAIDGISPVFYIVLALYLPLKFLLSVPEFENILDALFLIVVVFQSIKFILLIVDYWLKRMAKNGELKGKGPAKTTFHGIKLIITIVLWVSGILLILSNLGVNINSLVASLGIGGIAVALAVQSILGDIFSSFTIYFDKPFEIGDFVVLGADSGTVKQIGLKTTRIKTLQGQELIISNKELTQARVQNYKKMNDRRIVFNFGVTYDTGLKKVKKIPEIVKSVVESDERLKLTRVHFSEFADSSLLFECVYYVNSSKYDVFMDAKQDLNFRLMEAFEKEGIEFAYPTQTVFVKK